MWFTPHPAPHPTRMGLTWGQSLLSRGRAHTHQFDSYVFICIEILSCGGEGSQAVSATPPHTHPHLNRQDTLSDPLTPRGTSCFPAAPTELGSVLPDPRSEKGTHMAPALAVGSPSALHPHLPSSDSPPSLRSKTPAPAHPGTPHSHLHPLMGAIPKSSPVEPTSVLPSTTVKTEQRPRDPQPFSEPAAANRS